MTQPPTDAATDQRPGHHWREPERVQRYIAMMDARAAERADLFALLARLIPFGPGEPLRVLDLGAGHGVVAAAVLDVFPQAQADLLDVSEEMIRQGEQRLRPYGSRARYIHGDFDDGALPADCAGPYHAIVSSLAIHHLPATGKERLYQTIADRLAPGGCFLNLDSIAAPDDATAALYHQAQARERAARGEPEPTGGHHHSELQPLDDHLRWLRAAGLDRVDVFWKRLDDALFGGYKP